MQWQKSLIEYLGDIVNSKGNNIDLVEDRVKRREVYPISAMIQIKIEALIRETCLLGVHTINVHLLLHKSLFLPCRYAVWFNSDRGFKGCR